MDELQFNQTDKNSSVLTDDGEMDEPSNEIDPVLYVTILAIIVTAGVVGNCLIIVMFSTRQYRRQSFSVYIRALAISDSLALMYTLVDDTITRLMDYKLLYGNRSLCPVILFYSNICPALSSLLLVSAAVDRYIVVVFPLSRTTLCTFRRAIYTVAGLIVLAICYPLPEVIWVEIYSWQSWNSNRNWSLYDSEDFICPELDTFEYNLFYMIYSFLVILLFPFLIVTFLNVRVLWVVKSSLGVKVSTKTSGSQRISLTRVTIPVITVTISSVMLLLPLLIVEMLELVYQFVYVTPEMQEYIDNAWDIASVIRQLNYVVNFYIFMASAKNHRQRLKQMFGFEIGKQREIENSTSRRVDSVSSTVISTYYM